ncbi:LysR family transcriptional regulator [Pseudomonas kuykendallii]|uniref:Transcriptional regulator, LysR family n=1 Tax=Pseudomonas kuykendallii TaxID=1007099 RepID=A0A1H3CA96_9PSED|nr:LysR family transcriptional regulator [Pseudomonas kuykendallii]MCQ4269595.1 LysR family transcriptional regulator [Pseudomonas kuykendallii]SDX51043.1 transcriptional regulator, LysR family [Pseudomonas kuykendallii]
MHFDLADLRLFIHIAESPSLTQGARRAFLSPAAASARIKALEGQLGSRLLYRDSRGVELTPAGERLLQHARLIMRQVDYLKSEFASNGAETAGHIRIYANTTAVTEFLPEVLARFLAERPAVTVDLQEKLSRDIVRGVLDGAADLGIIAGPVEATGLQVLHFSTDHLVLAVPLGHPLASEQRVTLRQTLAYQHIGLHDGSTLLSFLRDHVERLGETLSLRIQMSSFEAICRMVEAGVGIGIIPESAARRHSRTMQLATVELDEPWAMRERSILVRELEALPGSVRALIATLRPDVALLPVSENTDNLLTEQP